MTWIARLKLFFGTLAVLVIVAALTVVFTQRQATADSTTATIRARSYPIGTDFGGLVTAQYVHQGEKVKAGQRLFVVQSKLLQNELATHQLRGKAADGVSNDGATVVTAAVPGSIRSIVAAQGSYAEPGTVLARVDKADSLYVQAVFTLAADDYARVDKGAEVDIRLPDQRTLTGHVSRIAVSTVAGQARTVLTVACPRLTEGGDGGLIAPGTPVEARVHLKNLGILAGPIDAVSALTRQMGI